MANNPSTSTRAEYSRQYPDAAGQTDDHDQENEREQLNPGIQTLEQSPGPGQFFIQNHRFQGGGQPGDVFGQKPFLVQVYRSCFSFRFG